jgi:hypothetical protein
MRYLIQPGGGDISQPKPYPFFADETGAVQRQDFWRGRVATVIGFAVDHDRHQIDIPWSKAIELQPLVVGTYLVTADAEGQFSTHAAAITEFREISE